MDYPYLSSPMPISPPPPYESTAGFTAIPRFLLDAALCSDMGKREMKVWLLVARLTYGAQGRQWVALHPADLRAIGIGSNHARTVLERMLSYRLLVQNERNQEYCIADSDAAEARNGMAQERRQQLRRLVARQMQSEPVQLSRNGKVELAFVPKTGNQTFPKWEGKDSQNRNASMVPAWSFSRSQSRFVRKEDVPIDKTKTKINNQPTSAKED